MKILLVTERLFIPRGLEISSFASMTPEKWVKASLKMGAARCVVVRLASIGVKCDASLSLLPPASFKEAWDSRLARRVWIACTKLLSDEYNKVFLCGRRVAQATTTYAKKPMLWFDKQVMLVPHTSGLNSWWNDEVEMDVAQEMVKEFLHE